MTYISNFAEAEAILAVYMPLAHDIIGKDITLDRMRPIMAALGNPEHTLRIIHIAGTSGKTSTAYYMASLLEAAGKNVGLTVSPHMDSVAERVQINLQPLSEEEFCKSLQEFLGLIGKMTIKPTYYELLIAFAYWYFARRGVDYAVIETGLGGLHDGSNVADTESKVCIITDIGYDHMHVLGKTIPKITLQKAGIIHKNNQVFTYGQSDEVLSVLRDWCRAKNALLHIESQENLKSGINVEQLSTLPDFKQRNWLLAYAVFTYIKKRDKLTELSNSMMSKSLKTYIPGRMDIVVMNGKKVVMDGAHNGQKMRAFINSFTAQNPIAQAVVLLAMKQNKEYGDVLDILKPIVSSLVVTDFFVGQDRVSSSVQSSILGQAAEMHGVKNIVVLPDLEVAFKHALSVTPQGGLLIVTGSLYLLSQLRNEHRELQHDRH